MLFAEKGPETGGLGAMISFRMFSWTFRKKHAKLIKKEGILCLDVKSFTGKLRICWLS